MEEKKENKKTGPPQLKKKAMVGKGVGVGQETFGMKTKEIFHK